jgi:hypothetical protein
MRASNPYEGCEGVSLGCLLRHPAVAYLLLVRRMNSHTILVALALIVLTSCASYASPEVSGPYAARLTQSDIRKSSELPFTGSGIRRGVHSIYAKKPDQAGVQSGIPKWPKDTIVSCTARKKAGRWQIVHGSISTHHLIPTD